MSDEQNKQAKKINHYKSILDMMQAGINLIDKDGNIIYVNDAYCKMHNYTKEELMGKNLAMILPNQNPTEGLKRYKKIINKEITPPFTVESINIRRDGTRFPVLISWNYLTKDDELDGMVTVVQDLTKIREVENALMRSEIKYKSLVENISDLIWETNEYGSISFVSPKSLELYSYKPKELRGKKIWDVIIDKDLESKEKLKKLILEKQAFSHLELYKQKKDGKILVIESSGIPIFENKKFLGFRGVDRDITALKKVEEIDLEVKELKDKLEKREYLEYIMGDSHIIREVHKSVEKVAKTDFSVIIYGETGTGKEIIANAIHNYSNRKDKTLISIDCGAIPETLIESELFGAVKGAFTGATETKDGAFQMANGGTIFLDEISNLPIEMQKRLLRVLQEHEVRKVGSTKTEKLDIRIIAASNENMLEMVNNGNFRKDLFFRLNEFSISLPPLRERKEDILMLTKRFIKEICKTLDITIKNITKEALSVLLEYDWPGNVRELKNIIKKAIVISDNEIKKDHFDLIKDSSSIISHQEENEEFKIENLDSLDLKKAVGEYLAKIEKKIIEKGLQKFSGNKSKTSKFFDIDYKTLLKKINDYDL